MSKTIISIDMGGTQLRAARLDEDLKIVTRYATPTNAKEGLNATLDRIIKVIREVMPQDSEEEIQGIGISAPGPLNPWTGVVVAPPNLPGWHNVPLVDIVKREYNLPTYLGNDANVAALAEAMLGAAKREDYRNVVFLTQSTGVGSGVIVDGRMLLGRAGLAAEAGHVPIVVNGQVSSIELECAGPSMARRARMLIEQGRDSMIADMVNGDLNAIIGRHVGLAAVSGDVVAGEIVAHVARIMGLGIVGLLHMFNPDIVVLGGGVAIGLGNMLFEPLRQTVEQYVRDPEYIVPIVPAELGDDVSLIGAAALVPTQGGIIDVAEVSRRVL